MDYKHTLSLNKNAWYIRFYVWLYAARQEDINFCKLFWGYVFAIPMLVLRPVFMLIGYILNRHEDKVERKSLAAREQTISRDQKKSAQSLGVKFLDKVATGFAKLRWAIKPIKYTVLFVFGATVLAFLALLVYIIATNLMMALYTTLLILAVFAGIGLLIGALVLIGEDRIDRFLTGIGNGAMDFFGMIGNGYHSVKSNTCPKIELKD